MGNVSQRVPSIHPMLAAAPRNVVIHHPDFARHAGSELGDAAALDGARSLALTAVDLLADAELTTATVKAFRVAKGLARVLSLEALDRPLGGLVCSLVLRF